MNKIKSSKGFTLMEMLIVVAIIAVLVAIAIPTFTSSLNKARVATDEANIRSGYASVMADILTTQYDANGATAKTDYYLQKDGSVVKTIEENKNAYNCFGNATADVEIAGFKVTGGWNKGSTVTYEYTPETVGTDGTTSKVKVEIKIVPKTGN